MIVPPLEFPARALIIGAADGGPLLEPWFVRSSKEAAYIFGGGELVQAYQDAFPRLNGLEGLFLMRIETPKDQADRYEKLAQAYELLEGTAFSIILPLGVTIDSELDGVTPLVKLLRNLSPTGEGLAMIGAEQLDPSDLQAGVERLLSCERVEELRSMEDAFRVTIWPGSVLYMSDGDELRPQSPAVAAVGVVAGSTPGYGLFGKELPWVFRVETKFSAEQRLALGRAGFCVIGETRSRGPYIDQAVTASAGKLRFLDDALAFQDALAAVKQEMIGGPINLAEIESRLRAALDEKVELGALTGYDLALSVPEYETVQAEVALGLNHSVVRITTRVATNG